MFNKRIVVTGSNIIEQIDTGEFDILVDESSALNNLFTTKEVKRAVRITRSENGGASTFRFYENERTNPFSSSASGTYYEIRENSSALGQRGRFYRVSEKGESTFLGNSSFPTIAAMKNVLSYGDGKLMIILRKGSFTPKNNRSLQITFSIESVETSYSTQSTNKEPIDTSNLKSNLRLQKTLNFFHRYFNNDNGKDIDYGLINNTGIRAKNEKDEGDTDFQYILRNDILSKKGVATSGESSLFILLRVFLGVINDESTKNTNIIKDYFDQTKNVNYGGRISAPRNKILNRSVLCSEYRVFYLNIPEVGFENYFHASEPTAIGAVDYIPLVFDASGQKISQRRVCLMRDNIGKKVFLIIDDPYRTDPKATKFSPEYVILQPKSISRPNGGSLDIMGSLTASATEISISKSVDIPSTITFELNSKTKNVDQLVDEEKLQLAINGDLIENSFYFMTKEKERIPTNQVNTLNESEGVFTLVSRKSKNRYNEGILKNEIGTNNGLTVKTDDLKVKILVKGFFSESFLKSLEDKDKLPNVKLIPKQHLKDFYTSVEKFKTEFLGSKYGEDDPRLELEGTAFNIPISSGKGPEIASLRNVPEQKNMEIEIIPKFDSRRRVVFYATTNAKIGNVDSETPDILDNGTPIKLLDITDLEYQTKIVSLFNYNNFKKYFLGKAGFQEITRENQSIRLLDFEEFEIYTESEPNNGLLLGTESGVFRGVVKNVVNKSNVSDDNPFRVKIIYSYPPYVNGLESDGGMKYDKDEQTYQNKAHVKWTVVGNGTEGKSLYSNDYLINDPEFISLGGKDVGESGTREIFLYNKDNLGNQIYDNEPYYRTSKNKIYASLLSKSDAFNFLSSLKDLLERIKDFRNKGNNSEADDAKVLELMDVLKEEQKQLSYLKERIKKSNALYKVDGDSLVLDLEDQKASGTFNNCAAILFQFKGTDENAVVNTVFDLQVKYPEPDPDGLTEYITGMTDNNGYFIYIPTSCLENKFSQNTINFSFTVNTDSVKAIDCQILY